jgi:hypothetical protein
MLQNFILFQAGWFTCVIGGASRDYNWAGVVAVTAIVVVHLLRAHNIRNEAMLILVTMTIGSAWDSVLMMAGIFSFSHGVVFAGLIPFWMIAMWALFATTLNVSMKWMKNKYLLAAAFGAIGGPVAYYAGFRIGAVEFENTLTALLAVGVGWSVIMPMLMALTTRFNGYQSNEDAIYEVKTA